MDSLMEVRVPSYYVVNRKLNDKELGLALHALQITPIVGAIITDVHDHDIARQFTDEVFQVSPTQAHEIAQRVAEDSKQPVLIIGEATVLDAYYTDGSKETIQTSQTEN